MSQNPLNLKRLHHAELWVGNAKQAAFYYNRAFGFSQTAYSGLETGVRTRASYVMEQSQVRLVLSTPLHPDDEMTPHIAKHGDGVRDLAFEVDNADFSFEEAIRRGADPAIEPHTVSDDNGSARHAAIRTYGDTIHSFWDLKDYKGPFLPGFTEKHVPGESVGLAIIDHCVGNVELGKMDYWAKWYSDVMGFDRYITFDDKDISTEYSALMSIVMSQDGASIKFPINEPAEGKKKSQIEEYLDFYHGPGVQHVALLTKDVIDTVRKLRDNGVHFLSPVGLSSEAEPSAANMARLIDVIRERQVQALFHENMTSPAMIDQLAEETGLPVAGTLYADALAAEGEASTWLGMMRHNARLLHDALGGASEGSEHDHEHEAAHDEAHGHDH